MRRQKLLFTVAGLLLVGAVGCADLEVTNVNNPDQETVVQGPSDIEGLISGSWRNWWLATTHESGINPMLSTASFQQSSMAANFGMVERSAFPRTPVGNHPADAYATNYQGTWDRLYRAIGGANDGLAALNAENMKIVDNDGNDHTPRARAFAHFVQGISHGVIALTYDQAFIATEEFRYDPTKSPSEQGLELRPYTEVLDSALSFLDKAIEIAEDNDFTIPATWMATSVTSDHLAKIAHSYKARFRADVARTPAERQAVDWDQVVADIEAGIKEGEDFLPVMDAVVFYHNSSYYPHAFWGAWGKLPYVVFGMADTSGAYQAWMDTPILDRLQIDIVTPDKRFPQGETGAEQRENPGLYFSYAPGGQANADRGTWRWSHYAAHVYDDLDYGDKGPWPELTYKEMRLLKAEAHLWAGEEAEAADLINETRVKVGGLPPVTAGYNPTPPNCVPRMPDGTCGDLFEALKWEKRMETYFNSFGGWYFNSRGWGDLPAGSFLDLPVPARDLMNFQLPVYTTGGVGGDRASPGSIFDPQS